MIQLCSSFSKPAKIWSWNCPSLWQLSYARIFLQALFLLLFRVWICGRWGDLWEPDWRGREQNGVYGLKIGGIKPSECHVISSVGTQIIWTQETWTKLAVVKCFHYSWLGKERFHIIWTNIISWEWEKLT